jgi:predicted acyltransferase
LSSEATTRLEALDVFRGLTVASMLLVNNPGSWGAIYPPLAHAEWHGWTATDLIFPFFLFIVGITTFLSIEARRRKGAGDGEIAGRILRRAALIILIGLALNAFPFYSGVQETGIEHASFIDRIAHRFAHLRFTGVLQRIGVVYLTVALLALKTTRRQQIAITGFILAAYAVVMLLLPVPGSGAIGLTVLDRPAETMAAWFDRLLLAPDHIWKGGKTWDPEGPLSTIPAIATGLLGFLFASWMRERDGSAEMLGGLFAIGGLVAVAGQVMGWFFPINKNLWSSSYVLFTAGMAAMTYATILWLSDRYASFRRISRFFLPFGVNPMLAFVGSGVMTRLITSLILVPYDGKTRVLQPVLYQSAYASWLTPKLASLAYALTFVLVWFLILLPLHRKRIYWKV